MTIKNVRALLYAVALFATGHGIGASDGSGPDFWYPASIATLMFVALVANLLQEDD